MKKVFQYTFTTIAEWRKFLIVVLSLSILTLLESLPVVSIVAFLFEKLIFLSIGAFLIYLVKKSKNIESYYENLKINHFTTFMFHFIPVASGILFGLMIISVFWLGFFILILKATSSLYILTNPHEVFIQISNSPILTQTLLGFYSVYLLFFSYVFLGKLGAALESESFRKALIETISSLYDFKYWVKTFNLQYFIIYTIWSLVIGVLYIVLIAAYLFFIFPTIQNTPDLTLILIPFLSAITTILTYFTFFSAYFAHLSTKA